MTQPLRRLLELTRSQWDHDGERPAVRENFSRVLDCRTQALGGEVYASEDEEKVVYHTCKSRCCPSCGAMGTKLWQREQWSVLPEIPFVGVVLTMPDQFWPIFKEHRHLQHDLPALGAAVLKQYAWSRWCVKLSIIAVQHTFGGRLNHHPHLHLLVSAGGFDEKCMRWIAALQFNRAEIMNLWRGAVTSYLWHAHRRKMIHASVLPQNFENLLLLQTQRYWNINITTRMKRKQFLGYAGRYIRRLPISQRRILSVTETEAIYESKDTRNQIWVETRSTPNDLVALLVQHVPERYRHAMRYFGLLSPRGKHSVSSAMFIALGQQPRSRPPRLSWRASMIHTFRTDPLLDSRGQVMRWKRRLPPVTA